MKSLAHTHSFARSLAQSPSGWMIELIIALQVNFSERVHTCLASGSFTNHNTHTHTHTTPISFNEWNALVVFIRSCLNRRSPTTDSIPPVEKKS